MQVANTLNCKALNNLIGPTGPTGALGPPNPNGLKAFTLFVDYSSLNAISRVQIPAGLFTNPALAAGGVFTADVGTDLTFVGTDSILLQNTTSPFLTGFTVSGFVVGPPAAWQPIPAARLRPTGTRYSITADSTANLLGLGLLNVNGGSLTPKATSGIAAGFLVTITLFYI